MDPSVDLAALARIGLVPRALHSVSEPDLSCTLLGGQQPTPIVRRSHGRPPSDRGLALVDAEQPMTNKHQIPTLAAAPMGSLMPEIRRLAQGEPLAMAIDLTPLAESAPFGGGAWRPRSRDDLAEMVAAAGRPLWLLGVASADDAAVAAEAGIDAVMVDAALGRYLGAPATADILPEVVDAVAGVLTILAGGAVHSGVDVLRLLALGADGVVVAGDRSSEALELELRYALRLTGCANLSEVGYDIIFAPLFGDA
jgi:isopentenyl diphosphate isomerase/L-lactate dehydrogenase-like FMN-dependent dehydrogenase